MLWKVLSKLLRVGETSATVLKFRSMDPRGSYLLFRGIPYNCDTTRVRDQLANGRNKGRAALEKQI